MATPGLFAALGLATGKALEERGRRIDAAEELFIELNNNKNLRLKPGKRYKPGMTKVQVSQMFEEEPDSDLSTVKSEWVDAAEINAIAETIPDRNIQQILRNVAQSKGGMTRGSLEVITRGELTSRKIRAKLDLASMREAFKSQREARAYLQDVSEYDPIAFDKALRGKFAPILEDLLEFAGWEVKRTARGKFLGFIPRKEKIELREKPTRKRTMEEILDDETLSVDQTIEELRNIGIEPTPEDIRMIEQNKGTARQLAPPGITTTPETETMLRRDLAQPGVAPDITPQAPQAALAQPTRPMQPGVVGTVNPDIINQIREKARRYRDALANPPYQRR